MIKLKLLFVFVLGNCLPLFASQIDTLVVKSSAMNKSINNIVITPQYYNEGEEKYSTLYLLHGAYGDFTDWTSKVSSIKEYADTYNIIIVCPDGDPTSWYFDSPIDENMKYETYLSKELIDEVDSAYRTKNNKSNRAITGLSMGGHGAFYLAFRHQDIWGAAGSMSGGLDIRSFSGSWNIPERLGEYNTHKRNWEENTIINMVYLLNGNNLKLIFDCGLDDFFYDANKRMHQKLVERNIPHTYIERPGNHDWEYWSNAIKYQVLFFKDFFESNKTPFIKK